MVDMSATTQLLFDWLLSPFIWFALIFVFIAATFGFLWIRKKRKLVYEIIEIVDYDYGKTGFNLIKGGWFGKKKALKNWFDYGDERIETQDGDIIQDFSTEDFQEINGKRGIIVARDPVNPEILVPISKVRINGKEMLNEIAPAEYRDAALRIIDEADRETSDWTKQVVQWVLIGGTIIFALVSIIIIAQMVKHGQQEASDLIVEAGKTCLENAKEVCQSLASSKAGGSP
jgi:hypothetical protein